MFWRLLYCTATTKWFELERKERRQQEKPDFVIEPARNTKARNKLLPVKGMNFNAGREQFQQLWLSYENHFIIIIISCGSFFFARCSLQTDVTSSILMPQFLVVCCTATIRRQAAAAKIGAKKRSIMSTEQTKSCLTDATYSVDLGG